MNSNTVKPEKFDHLHLVYHFAVPFMALILAWNFEYQVKLFYIVLFPQYRNAIILYIFDILILNGFTLRFQMIKIIFFTAQPSQTKLIFPTTARRTAN